MEIKLHISRELAALLTGFSAYHEQSIEQYATWAHARAVVADCQTDHSHDLPEVQHARSA